MKNRSGFLLSLCFILSALILPSCFRSNIFVYLSPDNIPKLHVYPEPGPAPFLAPTRVWISTEARFSDWQIRYSFDAAANYADTSAWKDYDAATGLLLHQSTRLRAVAFKGVEGVSEEAVISYAFEYTSALVYVDINAAPGGDGLGPESAFNSIQAGIDLASSLYEGTSPVLVQVMSGEYRENIVMKPGLILRGSYQGDWMPPVLPSEPEYFNEPKTIIRAAEANNEILLASIALSIPRHTLAFPSSLNAPARVEHCWIEGPSNGSYSAGVYLASGGSTLETGMAELFSCRVFGGDGSKAAVGIWLSSRAVASVQRCDIRGRSGSVGGDSYALVNFDSLLSLEESWLRSGSGTWNGSLPYLKNIGLLSADTADNPASPVLRLTHNHLIRADESMRGTEALIAIQLYGGYAQLSYNHSVEAGSGSTNIFGQNILVAGIQAEAGAQLDLASSSVSAGSAQFSGPIYGGVIGSMFSAGIRAKGSAVQPVAINIDSLPSISAGWGASTSAGIYLEGSASQFRVARNNRISGGGGNLSFGIYLNPGSIGLGQSYLIEGNKIHAGSYSNNSSATSAGIGIGNLSILQEPLIIRNNIIHGGTGESYSGGTSKGLWIAKAPGGQDIWLLSNTILSGASSSQYSGIGVQLDYGNSLCLINNLMWAGRPIYAVNSSATTPFSVYPRRFENNGLYAETSYVYYVYGNEGFEGTALNTSSAISDGTALCQENFGNVDLSTQFMTSSGLPSDVQAFFAFDFNLAAGANSLLTAGGLDLSLEASPLGYSNDFLNRSRNTTAHLAWSVGAFEFIP